MAWYVSGRSFFRDSSDENDDGDEKGDGAHIDFTTNRISPNLDIGAKAKDKDKRREKGGRAGDTETRRQSIATSSLLPFPWSKITISDMRDASTSPERKSGRREPTLISISTSASKKQRRCSMSDAPACLGLGPAPKVNLNIDDNTPVPSAPASMMSAQEHFASIPAKKFAGNIHFRNPREADDGGDAEDGDSINCSSVGLLRSAFGSRSSSGKKRTAVGAGNQVTSLHSSNHLAHATVPAGVMPTATRRPTDSGWSGDFVHLFMGGESWNRFELNCDTLNLDLFWPAVMGSRKKEKGKGKEQIKGQRNEKGKMKKEDESEKRKGEAKEEILNPFDDEYEITISDDDDTDDNDDDDILPVEAIAPLCNFRNLRFLKLAGMSQSYQKYIWQAAWLNPGLETLELEMALEPCIRRAFSGWPYIKGGWVQQRKPDGEQGSYYGDDGKGILHRRVGIGEYLDKYAIVHAKARAARMGSTLNLLPVVKLTLTGFVVDAEPFHLFNPHRLRLISFKNDCVDAGFTLPERMREQVVVSWPKLLSQQAIAARRVKHGEIKLIDHWSKRKKLASHTPAYCSASSVKSTAITTAANTTTATAVSVTTAGKSKAAAPHKDTAVATPNFSYPNPHASVGSPTSAAKSSATADNTHKGKGKQIDGNMLCAADSRDIFKEDVKPQQRRRLFSSLKKARR
ncbi:uncharacterized protein BDCG_07435 [Blastomyces dermatitidis ER-3]|uniref:Uncharacterized protein n=3 Tax=Blastomyces TaxID=229219 RepID=A0A179V2R1_BLAGS|nr:uncharacterized protein BDBG_08778 [Blastomyces gilchristii SLH14081]XP_045278663.1 uncharacterized protein BDCG_07435 [Blastomyces dermatitidis ER-3]EGE86493.1 hypothetical protein BDDG_09438 [Blastomyces dermatitidis ATCC 18188]EQL29149.1 hypothetical protein BDFG_08187 [Blastomyces dermatitidis ATCC 26199]EEQ92315.2 hypothetical protein BDCG_07435 [Blastomyces dermatitidis ER-3]OAT13611.1 hypothetical protein BDBG_08778 [Blastomyces gilchristii SLH14081]